MSRRMHWAGIVLVAAAASAAHAWDAAGGGMRGPGGPVGGPMGGPGGAPTGGMAGPGMRPGGPPPMQRGDGATGDASGQDGTTRPERGHGRGPGGGPRGAIGALMRAADADDSRDVTDEEWTAFLDGLVADENGAVSLDDLASKLPEPPEGFPEDAAVRDEMFVRAFDADGDGVVTKSDLQAIRDREPARDGDRPAPPQGEGERPRGGRDCGPAGALMRAADADDSKDVTAEEWTAFLDGLVADESGAVSLDDLASKLPEPRGGWPEDTAERDARFVEAFDADGDGVVTKTDLQAVFDRIDRDDDGAVAKTEQRPPKALRGRDLRFAKALARAADADDSRDVTAQEWSDFLAGLVDDAGAVSLDALAAAIPAPRNGWPTDLEKRDAMLVRAFDADRDGAVTGTDLQALFDALDRNQDGALDSSDAPRRR